jgi:type I restriction enzyme M protein
MPDVIARWKGRDLGKDADRTAKAFFVPVGEIRENKYDLSINRYKEVAYEEAQHEPPREILTRLRAAEREILSHLDELERLLGQ